MGRRGGCNFTLQEAYSELRSDYNAAKETRFRRRLTGVQSSGSGADYHYRSESDYLRMLELARSIDRNDPVVGQAVNRVVQNVLQQGMRLDPDTGDDALDADLKERFRDWSKPQNCHAAKEHSFHKLAKLTLRARIVDGDTFHLLRDDETLQPVEGHRCRTPMNTKRPVVHGVMLDPDTRERREYWFTKEDVNPMRSLRLVSEVVQVQARDEDGNRNVLQVYDPKRFTQTRGVTAFAPIVDVIGMHDDINFAKLVQQQIVSCWAIIRETPADWVGVRESEQQGAETTETLSDGSVRTLQGIAPGMDVQLRPGEKAMGFSPHIPNAEYFEHVTLMLTFIAVNLGLPRHVLLLDPSDTNFSGWRGAIDQARQGFKEIQDDMIEQFYTPVYEWKLRQWAASDAALRRAAERAQARFFRHFWVPPFWQYIEPNKDASADKLIIDNRLNSRRETLARRGLDIEEVDADIVSDNTRFIEQCLIAAAAIQTRHPESGVTWRDVAFLQAPKLSASVGGGEADEDEPADAGRSRNGNGSAHRAVKP